MNEKDSEVFNPFHRITDGELHELIVLYASEICETWNGFREYMHRLNLLLESGEVEQETYNLYLHNIVLRVKKILSKLLIEQYYNTGDDFLFDSAMRINEDIRLEDYSVIDLNEIEKRRDKNVDPVIIFYRGMFFNLMDISDGITHPHIKVIVREEEDVKKVNKKLSRGRMLLQIDEVSLGKKFYEGLCERTHFI